MKEKITIEISGCNGNFISEIYVGEKWFKEVGGAPSIPDLFLSISDSLKNEGVIK